MYVIKQPSIKFVSPLFPLFFFLFLSFYFLFPFFLLFFLSGLSVTLVIFNSINLHDIINFYTAVVFEKRAIEFDTYTSLGTSQDGKIFYACGKESVRGHSIYALISVDTSSKFMINSSKALT
jgi:hypothetical protein